MYAVIRVVPRVEREEFVNAGVIVLPGAELPRRPRACECRAAEALWPELDVV